MAGTGGARKGRDVKGLKDQWMPLTEPLEHTLDNQAFLGNLMANLADKNLRAVIIYDIYGRMILWRKIYAADLIDQRGKTLARDHPWAKLLFNSARQSLDVPGANTKAANDGNEDQVDQGNRSSGPRSIEG